jgi:hypothetical protein
MTWQPVLTVLSALFYIAVATIAVLVITSIVRLIASFGEWVDSKTECNKIVAQAEANLIRSRMYREDAEARMLDLQIEKYARKVHPLVTVRKPDPDDDGSINDGPEDE